jgi:hypothetical protein
MKRRPPFCLGARPSMLRRLHSFLFQALTTRTLASEPSEWSTLLLMKRSEYRRGP